MTTYTQAEQEKISYKLAMAELARLKEENFGRLPSDDWTNQVLAVKDNFESKPTRCCNHDSDCAVHNMPAYPAGPCDCTQLAVSKVQSSIEGGAA